jgi:hypothetical protein
MCEGKNKMDLEGAEREYLNWIDGSENIQKWRVFFVHIVMYLRGLQMEGSSPHHWL